MTPTPRIAIEAYAITAALVLDPHATMPDAMDAFNAAESELRQTGMEHSGVADPWAQAAWEYAVAVKRFEGSQLAAGMWAYPELVQAHKRVMAMGVKA